MNTIKFKKQFSIAAITLALISCRTTPSQPDWVPDSPAFNSKYFQCLALIQDYSKGNVLAFSWADTNLKVDYHYSLAALPGKAHPEFILQDEFGNTFSIHSRSGTAACKDNSKEYCLKFKLPLEEKSPQHLRLAWLENKISIISHEIPRDTRTLETIPRLFDRDFVLEDLKRRWNNLSKDKSKGLITPNILRRSELDQLKPVCIEASK